MERILPKNLSNRWNDTRNLIQVVLGPRQVGKTTSMIHRMEKASTVFASADLPTPPTPDFIVTHWQQARQITAQSPTLILDEIQKIPRWSETVKMLWDEDQRNGTTLKIWILGSSAILIEKGMSESLAGRFEMNFFPHWIYPECRAVFGASPEAFASIGGYPKAYSLKDDSERLQNYIQSSIIETTLGRDILTLHAVDKPALLRQLFWYTSKLPAQTVSFEKILGHLQGRGNSATIAHYADLLSMAFILLPISKFSTKAHRTRRSIPKWILPNPALVDDAVRGAGLEGFVFENLIGGHIANLLFGNKKKSMHYWRDGDHEIDFILAEGGKAIAAIEVKSGRVKKLPSRAVMNGRGFDCPLTVVSIQNYEELLSTTSIDDLLSFCSR